jgi:putative Mg2+ transporter-C (MgtC) family protein
MENLVPEMQYLLRVAIAIVLGFAIGVERKIRYKEAGMRTHSIVAGGAALMTVVGMYGFGGSDAVDGSRVAAQIVTGIGFLGAGIIMYKRDALHGLTTAAGIWATAGVGMAAGAGMYVLATGSAIMVIFVQWFLHLRIKFFLMKRFYLYRIKFRCPGEESETVKKLFEVTTYSRISFSNDGVTITASADIKTDRLWLDSDIKRIMDENDFIASMERVEE